MKILLTFADGCVEEKRWISKVLIGDMLGLPYEIRFGAKEGTSVSIAGKTLAIADEFFAAASASWLGPETLPKAPLPVWHVADSGLQALLLRPAIPVLFGKPGFARTGANTATMQADIFGAVFFMLTRYEEAASNVRDGHDRYPASASIAYRSGFLDRPIVDEYVEILWAALRWLCPQLARRQRQFRTIVSCDVDHPYHPSARSLPRLLKRTAGEAMRRRTWPATVSPLRNYIASRRGNWSNDPYYFTIDWIMQVNERAGNRVAFYFIPEITDTEVDDTCAISDPAVIAMMHRIASRRHEIGIHPGYRTYQSIDHIRSGLNTLQQLLQRQGITQTVAGGRQHYLRWSVRTPGIWNDAGLQYDSTLGYAEHAGFRCGTCHEYTMFDLCRRIALDVVQRPLICMEVSVITHMGFGETDAALEKMLELKATARRFDGDFTLLWHNSSFESEQSRRIYQVTIA